jgi:hypothetical protein
MDTTQRVWWRPQQPDTRWSYLVFGAVCRESGLHGSGRGGWKRAWFQVTRWPPTSLSTTFVLILALLFLGRQTASRVARACLAWQNEREGAI